MSIFNYSGPILKAPFDFSSIPIFTAVQMMLDDVTVIRRGILCVTTPHILFWMEGISAKRTRGESPAFVDFMEKIPDSYIPRLSFTSFPIESFTPWLKSVPPLIRDHCGHSLRTTKPYVTSPFLNDPTTVNQSQSHAEPSTKPRDNKGPDSKRKETAPKSRPKVKISVRGKPAVYIGPTSPPSSMEREPVPVPDHNRLAALENRVASLETFMAKIDRDFTDHVTILYQKGFY